MAEGSCVIELRGLKKYFPVRQNLFSKGDKGAVLKAVNGVNFKLSRGESLGLAGESGCGKTTTGKMLLKLYQPTAGKFLFNGKDVTDISTKAEIKEFRKQAQLVFQNPFEALNPRFTILRSVIEPLIIHKIGSREEQTAIAREALEKVNLTPAESFFSKYPHQMSGGQLQRVVLARALVVRPIFLVADEPVSMLDVSVRAGVLNLMRDITREMQLTTIYISHDLSLIQYMCDYTAIMYLGKIVEWGTTGEVMGDACHPYTRALIEAVPVPDPEYQVKKININNQVPSPINLPPGCIFQERCPEVKPLCREKEPEMNRVGEEHEAACHLV